ncbi:ARAT1-like protein, partial [Mya arenaria]
MKHVIQGKSLYFSKMAGKKSAKDLFAYLALYDENSEDHANFVPLSMGAPGKATLSGCNKLMTEATNSLLRDSNEERFTFQYGPCKGDPSFCEQVAGFLTEEYGTKVDSSDIMVSAGATQGLHLVATVMFNKDTPIFIEDPTYFIAVKILREDFGMNIIPVPTDMEGIDVAKLESLLEIYKPKTTGKAGSQFWSMVYTIPTYNNPKGYCMSPERCRALVKLARKYGVMLFAEDVYNMLHYDDKPQCPPRLLQYDDSATAWSGGSFNHYTSKLMAVALQEGLLQKHLTWLRKEYRERMDLACNTLEKHLPAGVKVDNPHGGFFIWLQLPPSIDSMELLKLAVQKYKVNFIFGARLI